MRKLLLVTLLLLFHSYLTFAQFEEDESSRFVNYAGVQLNPLLRQILNFNSSNTTNIVSPYLITYSINKRSNGSGLRIGFGANYSQTSTDNGVTKNETNEVDYEIRLGYDKRFKLGKRWETGVGIDLLLNNMNNHTITTTRDFETDITNVTDNNLNYGLGPMGWIRFYLTKRILLGTEASIYYTRGNPKETISEEIDSPNQAPQTNSTTNTFFSASATITLPVAFYLILKF